MPKPERLLKVFATTYNASLQDSLYRMGMAALTGQPEIADISMACPSLTPFGLENANQVFVATEEPHDQIECTVGR